MLNQVRKLVKRESGLPVNEIHEASSKLLNRESHHQSKQSMLKEMKARHRISLAEREKEEEE